MKKNSINQQECIVLLKDSQATMMDLLSGISEELFLKQLTAETWSVAEVIEHVIKVEQGVIDNIILLSKGQSDESLDQTFNTEQIIKLSSDRTLKSKAPEIFTPIGIFKDKSSAVKAFMVRRAATIDFIGSTNIDLTTILAPHPRIGMMNGENWMVFISGHCLKHVAQIKGLYKLLV